MNPKGWLPTFWPNGNSMIVMLKRHAVGPDPGTIINTQALRNTCGPSRSRTGFWDIKRGPPDRSAPTLDRNERSKN